MREESVASWTIFIKKTVLWFSAGSVWSVGFPICMGTRHPTPREGGPMLGALSHVSINKSLGLIDFEIVQESREFEGGGR
jgi:hypothetical protein